MLDPVLNDISHRRYNPLRGSWVLVSPHRTKRPWQGAQESAAQTTLPEHDPACYLCPGNARAGGAVNPAYAATFVFVNDYSAVKAEQTPYEASAAGAGDAGDADDASDPAAAAAAAAKELLRVEPVTGTCYVLTFSAAHNRTLADMAPADILPVVRAWTRIYMHHLAPSSRLAECQPPLGDDREAEHMRLAPAARYRYMQIFENKGAAMGCSNPHPHGQVWTTTGLPEEPALELAQLSRYRREHGGAHLLEAYAALEAGRPGERVVFANATFMAVCPWWGTWPFEVLVVSRARLRALADFGEQEQADLAEAIAEVTRRYDNLFETHFPYSMGLHQAPLDGSEEEVEASHFHLHFYPPLLRSATVRKFLVGYEMMAEPQRDITPEQAAERLRKCDGELYRNKIS